MLPLALWMGKSIISEAPTWCLGAGKLYRQNQWMFSYHAVILRKSKLNYCEYFVLVLHISTKAKPMDALVHSLLSNYIWTGEICNNQRRCRFRMKEKFVIYYIWLHVVFDRNRRIPLLILTEHLTSNVTRLHSMLWYDRMSHCQHFFWTPLAIFFPDIFPTYIG